MNCISELQVLYAALLKSNENAGHGSTKRGNLFTLLPSQTHPPSHITPVLRITAWKKRNLCVPTKSRFKNYLSSHKWEVYKWSSLDFCPRTCSVSSHLLRCAVWTKNWDTPDVSLFHKARTQFPEMCLWKFLQSNKTPFLTPLQYHLRCHRVHAGCLEGHVLYFALGQTEQNCFLEHAKPASIMHRFLQHRSSTAFPTQPLYRTAKEHRSKVHTTSLGQTERT